MTDPRRHHRAHDHLHGLFADDTFGRIAEKVALFMGTPVFLIGQTCITAVWIVANLVMLAHPFDPYPFILLNLAYSIQAGFAGPFVLCAQGRQALRDKAEAEADARHREELTELTHAILKDIKSKIEERA